MAWIAAYLAAGAVFLGADALWLSLAGPRLYRPTLGPLLAYEFNAFAAIAFYLIYLAGVLTLAIAPALASGRPRDAALKGLTLGLVAYATYDLTNQATLRIWSTRLTVLDMLWGGGLTAAAALAGYVAARRLR